MSVGEAPRDPEQIEAQAGPARGEMDGRTGMGPVHLTVSDLEASLAFYRSALGLEVLESGAGEARLGSAERELLALVEHPGAAPSRGHTGLYHLALLLPERSDLARWLAHTARERLPLTGLSDHFVSEAVYLDDPDGHGIEVYWDRPRSHWEGQVAERMTTQPLDVGGLLGELDDPATEAFEGLAAGAIMGHVHLKVAEVASTVSFYRDVLGFGLMARLGPVAAFFSAGGYHHHIGGNTWESAGASPPPEGSAALRHATILLPGSAERDRVMARVAGAGIGHEDAPEGPLVRDPSGNGLVLALAP